ncbi:GNAT family N-acetyltransferase [Thalassobacillus hwangdonensis]|uniref:GNAT family N-acetyltransferase n=1 Tax=Thalassobacillus hwangdonensis TaxID=546108 RepID=A0ABW3L2V8_9BACI
MKCGDVKVLKGPDYITIEKLEHLTPDQTSKCIDDMEQSASAQKVKRISLVHEGYISEKKVDLIQSRGYHFVRKRIGYELDFKRPLPFSLSDKVAVKKADEETIVGLLGRILNVSDAEREVLNIKSELGEEYEHSLYSIHAGGKGVGVVIPHIEPGTSDEGRLFYIGIDPEYQGKGYGREAHRYGIHLLKDVFGAVSYVGMTDESNHAMQAVFEKNHCRMRNPVYVFTKAFNGSY